MIRSSAQARPALPTRGDQEPSRELEESPEPDVSFRTDRRRIAKWALGIAIGLVALRITVALLPGHLAEYARGETDLKGRRVYVPRFGVDTVAVAAIDLERVHRILFPAWVLTLNNASTGDQAQRERLAALRVEAGKDRNLAVLLDELVKASGIPRNAARARRFDYLIWAWSDYLDRAGAAWRLEPTVRTIAGRQTLYVKAYRVVATVHATLSGEPCRARLLSREDRLNVVEPYLGHTASRAEGALVILDRTREFAENQVWAMLNEANDATLPPLEAAFAPSIRAEVESAIGAEARPLLRETSIDRHALLRTARDINDRERCGSSFRLWHFPSVGLPRWTLDMAARAVATTDVPCPQVTAAEARTLEEASGRLTANQRLPGALLALDGWVARAVTIHELRHAGDGGLDGEPLTSPCVGCAALPTTARLGRAARGELSAYLSGLGSPGTAYVSAYQACAGAQEGTAAGAAIAALRPEVLPRGCAGTPPPDLVTRARAFEARLFGRVEPVSLAEGFPLAELSR